MPKFRRARALIVGSALTLLVGVFSLDYTVKPGDSLGRIAREHGVSVADLVGANGISNPNLIFVGQKLVIPGSDEVHVVSFGETLGRIAKKYGSSVSAIATANSMTNPNLVLVGQELIIPTGGGGSSSGGSSSGGSNGGGTSPNGGDSSEGTISDRSGQVHIVKRGETLSRIASQYNGVSANDLAVVNGIVNGIIYYGQALYLQGPSYVAKGGGSSETTYKVRNGDRLGDIAHAHGVSISSITSANNIRNANLIRVGQVLTIPGGGGWVCPVEGASFKNDWGFPRGGGTRYHEGNDLFVSRGTPVRAPASGNVKHRTGTIGGKQFTLTGNDGVTYIGTHMDQFGASGSVSAGTIIGYVGNTGNAVGTSPHLHFGMRYKGTPVNPYPSLVANGCK